jgi:ribosome biogenesis protein YTM1
MFVLDSWEDVSLSFLLNGLIICTPLSEFVQTNTLNTESVLEIECVLKEPAPIPDQNIVDDDWVSSVLVTGKW